MTRIVEIPLFDSEIFALDIDAEPGQSVDFPLIETAPKLVNLSFAECAPSIKSVAPALVSDVSQHNPKIPEPELARPDATRLKAARIFAAGMDEFPIGYRLVPWNALPTEMRGKGAESVNVAHRIPVQDIEFVGMVHAPLEAASKLEVRQKSGLLMLVAKPGTRKKPRAVRAVIVRRKSSGEILVAKLRD